MILLLFLALTVIYIQFGLFVLIQIVIWIIVFLSSNFLIGINPFSRELHIIRFMSILVMIFILYFNIKQISIGLALILPLSIDKITYLDEVDSFEITKDDFNMKILLDFKKDDIEKIIKSLDDNSNYLVDINLYLENDGYPKIILCKPFLINKFSSPTTIFMMINEQLFSLVDLSFYNDMFINSPEMGLVIKYYKCKIE